MCNESHQYIGPMYCKVPVATQYTPISEMNEDHSLPNWSETH